MKIPTFKNLFQVILDQGPFKRFVKNFFITRNAWGLFHTNSHVSQRSNEPKIDFSSKDKALKAATSMERKNPNKRFSAYKCLWCDNYHIGGNLK